MGMRLEVARESWPIAGAFTISRGAKTTAEVVVATVREGDHTGRGECVPYARYGESVEAVVAQLASLTGDDLSGLDRAAVQTLLPPGAARNALDCALWDLAAKRSGTRAHVAAGLDAMRTLQTAYTLSLGTPDAMEQAARKASHHGLLKLKLGGGGDAERLQAVRAAVPDARLIVDANEAWTGAMLEQLFAACAETGVELIEQPLPAGDDAALAHIQRPVPVCADESAHGADAIAALADRYDAVNIKLDKTGGLTGALLAADAARDAGLKLMVGCMVGTSLAMAPALILAQTADWVDLDGPLLLARDRVPGLVYRGGWVEPPVPALWG